jgi:hypothetical protein
VLGHNLGEPLVDFDVWLPVPDMERDLVQQIMKERPEDAVSEPFVIPRHLLRGQGNRDQPHFGELVGHLRPLMVGQLVRGSRPANPEPARLFVGSEEPGGEAAGALLDLHSRFGGTHGDREPVSYNQNAGHAGKLSVIREVVTSRESRVTSHESRVSR